MQPGVFAKTYAGGSLEQALDGVRADGLIATQLNLALLGGPPLPEEIQQADVARIRGAVESRGLVASAISGTWNMAHPDPEVRRLGDRRLRLLIETAPKIGVFVVTLCTGTRDPNDMWAYDQANTSPEAWKTLFGSLGSALEIAEEHEVTLAFEPEPANVVADARDARRLIDLFPSPRLAVLIDGANLVQGKLDRQTAVLDEAFELLTGEIILAHAKDLDSEGTVVPAGQGQLDYDLYLRLLEEVGYDGPLILHGLQRKDVPEAAEFLRAALDRGSEGIA